MYHERQMILVVVEAVVVQLELVLVVHYCLALPALVATAGSAVVHHSAVTPLFALGFVLAWQ